MDAGRWDFQTLAIASPRLRSHEEGRSNGRVGLALSFWQVASGLLDHATRRCTLTYLVSKLVHTSADVMRLLGALPSGSGS